MDESRIHLSIIISLSVTSAVSLYLAAYLCEIQAKDEVRSRQVSLYWSHTCSPDRYEPALTLATLWLTYIDPYTRSLTHRKHVGTDVD